MPRIVCSFVLRHVRCCDVIDQRNSYLEEEQGEGMFQELNIVGWQRHSSELVCRTFYNAIIEFSLGHEQYHIVSQETEWTAVATTTSEHSIRIQWTRKWPKKTSLSYRGDDKKLETWAWNDYCHAKFSSLGSYWSSYLSISSPEFSKWWWVLLIHYTSWHIRTFFMFDC